MGWGKPGAMEPLFSPHCSHGRHPSSYTRARACRLPEICGAFDLPANPSDSELWGFQVSLPLAQMASPSNHREVTRVRGTSFPTLTLLSGGWQRPFVLKGSSFFTARSQLSPQSKCLSATSGSCTPSPPWSPSWQGGLSPPIGILGKSKRGMEQWPKIRTHNRSVEL